MRVPPASIYFPAADRAWILAEIEKCLESGQLTLGKNGAQLEAEFAHLCATKHAIAVNSGTSALEIIFRAIGVEGRDVIVPSNTFYATAGAVVHAGGQPRFVDCEPTSFALDPDALRGAINEKTAAVCLVHIGGTMTPRINEILDICRATGIPLVEDAAHAQGSTQAGKPAGSFGAAAAFSFYPTKVMTSAEGGIIVTNDDRIDQEARIYRDQGKEGFATNFHVRLGYNWRLSEPHAVIGLAQLRRLREFVDHRNEIAAIYDEGLGAFEGTISPRRPSPNGRSNYYKYIAMLNGVDRAVLKKTMREEFEVGLSGEVYDTPCHLQPVFAAYRNGLLPQAEAICANHICLPISATITQEEARYVLHSLGQALEVATKSSLWARG
jgi:perosamine synthetase